MQAQVQIQTCVRDQHKERAENHRFHIENGLGLSSARALVSTDGTAISNRLQRTRRSSLGPSMPESSLNAIIDE